MKRSPVTFPGMSMQWDPLLAAAVARELAASLRGARVRSLLLDRGSRRLFLYLRGHTLVAELAPGQGWISLLPTWEPPPGAKPFPYIVSSVRAPTDESILTLGLSGGRRGRKPLEIVLELIRNRQNALVVETSTRTIRHVLLPRQSPARPLTVGAAYRLPPRPERAGANRALSAAEWRELAGTGTGGSPRPREAILRRVAWSSPVNVAALDGPRGWERWKKMIEPASWGGFVMGSAEERFAYPVALTPGVTEPRGWPGGESPAPQSAPGGSRTAVEPKSTLLEAIRAARESDREADPIQALALPPGLIETARGRLRRARRRVESLKRQVDEAPDPATVRALGSLLLARLSEIPGRSGRVTTTDFAGNRVEIGLDPALSPSENANRFFEEAARAERAREALPGRLREGEREVERWSRALDGLRRGEIDRALLPAVPAGDGKEKDARARREGALPYRRFVSSGGLEIRVGRGARENDDLTFRHSRPNDIWMHAQQSPGAHVILRWRGEGRPPRRDLAEGAALAALHSSARHSGRVAVAWTRRKYVRKPRGAAAGRVVPGRVETVFVAPDPTIMERLSIPP